MKICKSKLARVTPHAIGKPVAPFILLEHFRLNKQAFRRGWSQEYRRNRPSIRLLPIVPVDVPKLDGYGSRYRPGESRPMTSIPLDLV